MSKSISMIALLLLGAQVNLTALVPAAAGQAPPPWWVGGGLLWPFFADTRTLLPRGDLLNTLTPILGITAAACFLMAAAALLGWLVPGSWLPLLVLVGAVLSIALQVMWLSGWAVLPLLVDVALIWAVVGPTVSGGSVRA
jgi:hypothetical protein